jgi:hypothetical protein
MEANDQVKIWDAKFLAENKKKKDWAIEIRS